MEGFIPLGVFIVIIFIWTKITNYMEDKKAKKEIPTLENEIKILNNKKIELQKYEDSIQESVKSFREYNEQRKAQKTYFAKRRNRKRY